MVDNMSKSMNGNIWRLDKGIKRLEKSISEVDSGIAHLKRESISECQYNRMREEIDIIADSNQEIIRKLEEASERKMITNIVDIVFFVCISLSVVWLLWVQ